MSTIFPTVDTIEEHLQHVEQLIINTISSSTPSNMADTFRNAFHRLQEDVSRFWPQSLPPLPEIKMPNLGAFEVPPPPPPLPVPKSGLEKAAEWAGNHPWKAMGVGLGVVGVGVFVGAVGTRVYRVKRLKRMGVLGSGGDGERRQVVDEPLAFPLIESLQRCGYIVVASVRTLEAADKLERTSEGYLRAIVLDPSDLSTIPSFLRSLSSTMSRRFPITVSGDPHSSPNTQLYIHSIISFLSMPSPHHIAPTGPLENLSLQDTYPAYLQATHFAPLQIIQSLLPLMRNSPRHIHKTIIICLPAISGQVGLPFAGAQAMSAAATLRGVEVLRREILVAAATETHGGTYARSMKNVGVVVVDVGNCGQALNYYDEDVERAMMDWSASEKVTYGVAFSNALVGGGLQQRVTRGRRRGGTESFVRTLVDVVSDGMKDPSVRGCAPSSLSLTLAPFRQWWRGDRFGVGAGVWTYAIASRLPTTILDRLLVFPHVVLHIRNIIFGRNALPYPPPPVVHRETHIPPPPPPSAPAAARPQHQSSPADPATGGESDWVWVWCGRVVD
ncbi:hypothetical protein BDY19DRAFT_363148 [Irpex rosettiformis]|uniref:Uncharacterized protein n=1 Tax=Irpex rosettiformis TaxID=378272 RepID=A0ACB8TWB3_9APHY|nr:hypothetical protein BDY19DRAFT_363148 [Irpex rosettiformis]